jgi:hypothetical protein
MEKSGRYSAYLSPVNNNIALCAAWSFSSQAHRFYWIFNCKLYCPLSVALFRYAAYLVMIVENWWCPFAHNKKQEYAEAAIDKSYWHLHAQERERLHPDDCDNPIWNEAPRGSKADSAE